MNLNYLVILLALVFIIWGGSSLVLAFSSIRKALSGLQLVGHIAKALSLVLAGFILGLLFWPLSDDGSKGITVGDDSRFGSYSIVSSSVAESTLVLEELARTKIDDYRIPQAVAANILTNHKNIIAARESRPIDELNRPGDSTRSVYLPLPELLSAIRSAFGTSYLISPRLNDAGLYLRLANYGDGAVRNSLPSEQQHLVKDYMTTVVGQIAEKSATGQITIVDAAQFFKSDQT
jgi:hypothetical protein